MGRCSDWSMAAFYIAGRNRGKLNRSTSNDPLCAFPRPHTHARCNRGRGSQQKLESESEKCRGISLLFPFRGISYFKAVFKRSSGRNNAQRVNLCSTLVDSGIAHGWSCSTRSRASGPLVLDIAFVANHWLRRVSDAWKDSFLFILVKLFPEDVKMLRCDNNNAKFCKQKIYHYDTNLLFKIDILFFKFIQLIQF